MIEIFAGLYDVEKLGKAAPTFGTPGLIGRQVGELFVTRYASSKILGSSKHSRADNLAGKFRLRLRNTANLLRKFLEFESSPGHQ